MARLDVLLADIATALLGTWALARGGLGDRQGGLGMVNAWSGWLTSAGLAAAGHSVFYRGHRRAGGALLVGAGLAALRAVGWKFPTALDEPLEGASPTDTTVPISQLRVMTVNLLFRHQEAAQFVAVVDREQPDIVLVQELTPTIAAHFQQALGQRYPYQHIHAVEGAAGFGILSRLPLGEASFLRMRGSGRFAQRSSVVVDGRHIDIYNCHLMPPIGLAFWRLGPTITAQIRAAQIRLITDTIQEAGRPALVAGDFNLSPYQETYQLLGPTLIDSWQEAGAGPGVTWPLNILPLPWRTMPLLRIDYCCHTAELRATRARVVYDTTGSDHCPVVVDLVWAQAQRAGLVAPTTDSTQGALRV